METFFDDNSKQLSNIFPDFSQYCMRFTIYKYYLTTVSISQVAAPTIWGGGTMNPGVEKWVSLEKRRESASGFPFLDPGQKERVELKRLRKRDQQAWREFNLCAEWINSRFLWSVQRRNGSWVLSSQCCHSCKARTITSSSRLPTL